MSEGKDEAVQTAVVSFGRNKYEIDISTMETVGKCVCGACVCACAWVYACACVCMRVHVCASALTFVVAAAVGVVFRRFEGTAC